MSKKIAIIGGGPIGLEAALYAKTLGHDVVVFERGQVADNVRQWSFVTLFSPWRMNLTPLGLRTLRAEGVGEFADEKLCPTGEQFRQGYLLPLAASRILRGAIQEHTTVIRIGKDDYTKSQAIGDAQRATSPFRILVETEGRERIERADVVLDCTGTYGHHRWAGRGGIPAPGERALEKRVWYSLPDVLGRDRARFAGRHTLVIGAGYSAATVLRDLLSLARSDSDTKVSWAIRRVGPAMQRMADDPLVLRQALVDAARRMSDDPPKWLQFLGDCVLERIEANGKFAVTLKYVKTDLALTCDEVIATVGYSPDNSIYEQLQVHECYATQGPINLSAALLDEGASDCLSAEKTITADTLKNPEPAFYILGAKSFGTNSNFLLGIGHRQIRDVFRLIDPDSPDLYEAKR
jgi:hypothetical protein